MTKNMTVQIKKNYIGIDPGTYTGIAFFIHGEIELKTMLIHQAFDFVLNVRNANIINPVVVVFEDARLRKWFGNADREKLQGAGSIKRDCKIWEDFLTDNKIEFRAVAPKNVKTKLNAAQFNKITGYYKRSNEHERDAAMLIIGL